MITLYLITNKGYTSQNTKEKQSLAKIGKKSPKIGKFKSDMQTIKLIKQEYSIGNTSYRKLAVKYSLSYSTIKDIVKGGRYFTD